MTHWHLKTSGLPCRVGCRSYAGSRRLKAGTNASHMLSNLAIGSKIERPWQLNGDFRFRAASTVSSSHPEPSLVCTTNECSTGHSIGTITISNSQKLNILNSQILNQLVDACKSLSTDSSLRVVVLTGATTPSKAASFIGGADISEMFSLGSAESARTFITRIHHACQALREIPVPVIARVNGFALGAGLEIMAACDLRMCTKGSIFAMPEVKVGIPSVVEAALLPGLIGWGRTRRLLYLAENINASVAERWGLVEQVVEDEKALDEGVAEWVGKIVAMGPAAIRSQKKLIQQWERCSIDEGIDAGVDAFADAYGDGGKEPKEMMARFLNRKR